MQKSEANHLHVVSSALVVAFMAPSRGELESLCALALFFTSDVHPIFKITDLKAEVYEEHLAPMKFLMNSKVVRLNVTMNKAFSMQLLHRLKHLHSYIIELLEKLMRWQVLQVLSD